jgi:hypothetical protein
MCSAMRRQPLSSRAIVGFVLAFLLPIAGLVVSISAIDQIDRGRTERHRRGLRGRGLATAGVAVAGLLVLVALGVLGA